MHKHLTIAGTFDHFHKGHKYLIDLSMKQGQKVSIGITDEEMTKGKVLAEVVQSFEERKENVQTYIKENGYLEKTELFELHDIYGIAKDDKTLDSIYVTKETYPNAVKINDLRAENGLPKLEILTAQLLEGDNKTIISSSKIRLGELDRAGNSYKRFFVSKELFTAPNAVRSQLRDPIGSIILGSENSIEQAGSEVLVRLKELRPTLVIAVGDIVTQTLQLLNFEPDISFIDHKNRRKTIDIKHTAFHKHGPFENKAGTISSEVVLEYADLIPDVIKTKDHHQIIIEGEEDLLALPAIMLAPLKSAVLYGQFDKGIVLVEVDEKMKLHAKNTMARFL